MSILLKLESCRGSFHSTGPKRTARFGCGLAWVRRSSLLCPLLVTYLDQPWVCGSAYKAPNWLFWGRRKTQRYLYLDKNLVTDRAMKLVWFANFGYLKTLLGSRIACHCHPCAIEGLRLLPLIETCNSIRPHETCTRLGDLLNSANRLSTKEEIVYLLRFSPPNRPVYKRDLQLSLRAGRRRVSSGLIAEVG